MSIMINTAKGRQSLQHVTAGGTGHGGGGGTPAHLDHHRLLEDHGRNEHPKDVKEESTDQEQSSYLRQTA